VVAEWGFLHATDEIVEVQFSAPAKSPDKGRITPGMETKGYVIDWYVYTMKALDGDSLGRCMSC
jgi:hypothetical protein